jgi:putative sigma-54 modulation protein
MKPDDNQDSHSKIKIQGIHFEITDAMDSVIREKFAVLLRHNDYIIRINVRVHQDQTMGTERHYTATAQIEIGGPDLVASSDGKDAYSVIDDLVDKLTGLLRRRQGRRKERRTQRQPAEIGIGLPKTE